MIHGDRAGSDPRAVGAMATGEGAQDPMCNTSKYLYGILAFEPMSPPHLSLLQSVSEFLA